jgi:hypothetical protein
MNWIPDNPAPNSPVDHTDDLIATNLRDLLATSEIAEFDDNARARVGELIARAVFDPAKQIW